MPAPRKPLLRVEAAGEVTVARIAERSLAEGPTLQALGEELDRLVDSGGCRALRLDFANVESLTSAALFRLIRFNKKLAGAKGRLEIINMRSEVYEVFRLTKLTSFFRLRGPGGEDEDGETGGVGGRLIPPKPSDSSGVALPSPPPEPE